MQYAIEMKRKNSVVDLMNELKKAGIKAKLVDLYEGEHISEEIRIIAIKCEHENNGISNFCNLHNLKIRGISQC